ncbi:MAG: M60 family metallopeptidase, partial [Verrucomicrobiota bacterium]
MKRGRGIIELNTAIPGWHSTGMYAAPGERIQIHVPDASTVPGLQIRIGAHTDSIRHHKSWRRMPVISRTFPIRSETTEAVNAFGGLIYVMVPKGGPRRSLTVKISHAVPAPWYRHGRTDLETWRNRIRHLPGPWAELGSEKIVLTVPSDEVRTLDDPEALMDTWDRVMELQGELAQHSSAKYRPERIVPDEQISSGYMHAGYPIMTHLDQCNHLVNREHLLKGAWGLYHELGHQHQNPDWTFSGTIEVTVNLFTLYVFEKLCGDPPNEHKRTNPEARRRKMTEYFKEGPDFDRWKSDPFLGLVMYVQLQQAFGWATYKKVFSEYLALPEKERPKGDAAKRDQWMVR